jgi:uncharacterized protein (TIGR02099 family)
MINFKLNNGFIIKSVSYFILILLALVMALFYWLSDAVEQQQETITSWVSEELGYPVEIAEIKLSWVRGTPQLELKTIKVMAQDNSTELLSLKTLYLDLNVLSSFWFADLRLEDITVIGLNIAVFRDANGQLALQGFNQGSDSTPLFADLMVRANSLNSFHLKTITVDYTDQQQTFLSGRYQIDEAAVKHRATNWQADGLITLPASLGDNVQFSASWALNQQQPELTTWQWTVKAGDVHLAPLTPYLHWENITAEQGRINATFNVKGVGKGLKTAKLDLDLSQTILATKQVNNALTPVVIEHFTGQFAWQQREQSWLLLGHDINLTMQGKTWPETTLMVKQENEETTVKSDFLRIEDLMAVAALSGRLPEQLIQQEPAGDIEQFEVQYHGEQGVKLASLKLKQGQARPWRDYPGVNNLKADIHFTEQVAKLKLASQQVTLHPASWLEDTVFFDEITGEVEFETNAQAWRLQGHALKVKNDDLTIQFDGSVRQNTEGKIVNDIALSLENIAVARWQSYFPEKLLSDGFKKWSKGAFLAGEVVRGQIKLQGDMAAFPYQSKQAKLLGSFDLALQVKDVQLHYAKGWPDLFDMAGSITGQGNNLMIKSQQGSVAGFAFQQVEANIDKLIEKKPILTVAGHLNGTSQQALNFLQNSPLKQRFGRVVKTVSAKGKSNINLNMTVPFADTDETRVKGNVSFIGSHLYKKAMPTIGLTQVNGLIEFHNKGVTAKNIKGQFLNQAVDINVYPKGDTTVVSANGTAATGNLRQTWPSTIPDFITGRLPYQLDVLISERNIGDFYVNASVISNLKGVGITLPAPLYKTAKQSKNIKAIFKQTSNSSSIVINYDDTVDITLEALASKGLFDNPKLDVTVAELDIEKWLLWNEQYQQGDTSVSGINQLAVNIGQLTGYGQQFSDLSITAQKERKNWRASIASQAIKGTVSIPEAITKQDVLHIDLEKLALALPQKTSGEDKVAKRPELWPSMAINVDALALDDTPLGHLKLISHQDTNKWVIDSANLTSEAYSGTVTKGIWQQSASGDKTELAIRIDSRDFASLLENFGYQPLVEAEKSKLIMAFSWPGEPLAFSRKTAKGTLRFKLEKGNLKEIEPGAAGRVFGLLSIATIPRRLALDFNELFGKGLNFRSIKGSFDIARGIATTQDLTLKSEPANIVITGPVDLVNQQYNQNVNVRPNVSSTLPLAGAVAGGPIGLGVGTAILLADKLAGKLFDKQIVNLISYNYKLTGPWQEPDLQVIKPTLPKL